ncbi:hypothetical protein OCU04_009945 [Sclerotinia nivalis]|uniref:Uncharacterized protein n=1 Tax=Sclerotinia nivalis TaxID=352851 RepID=A0A9X0AES4_9HELO|nr:hypothetical protein OCU04_009945 [Sclerotinia nivalis]
MPSSTPKSDASGEISINKSKGQNDTTAVKKSPQNLIRPGPRPPTLEDIIAQPTCFEKPRRDHTTYTREQKIKVIDFYYSTTVWRRDQYTRLYSYQRPRLDDVYMHFKPEKGRGIPRSTIHKWIGESKARSIIGSKRNTRSNKRQLLNPKTSNHIMNGAEGNGKEE